MGPRDQIMPDCLSGKGIGWLGDPGRKEVALPVGIYRPPQKNWCRTLLLSLKNTLYFQVFLLPVSLFGENEETLALKEVRGPCVPKGLRDFSANIPRFSVILGLLLLSRGALPANSQLSGLWPTGLRVNSASSPKKVYEVPYSCIVLGLAFLAKMGGVEGLKWWCWGLGHVRGKTKT